MNDNRRVQQTFKFNNIYIYIYIILQRDDYYFIECGLFKFTCQELMIAGVLKGG